MKQIVSMLLVFILVLSLFAGCRNLPDPEPTEPQISLEDPNGVVYESLAQKAVVYTALAYLARGTRIQYADTRFNNYDAPALYRWQHGVRLSPEEYTSQHIGYTNCAAFAYDVYLAALGHRIPGYATNQLTQITGKQMVYKYYPTGNETAQEQEAVEAKFRENLQIGDIIVIRYNGKNKGNGHAMVYVGSKVLEGVDGYKGTAAEQTDEEGNPKDAGYTYDIIHSTGSNYNYDEGAERFEKHGTVQMMATDSLFDAKTGRYVFGKLESIGILRPLLTFSKEVPENTLNRMRYMENIMAEKLSSHTAGMTVNPGENITYTISVTNKRNTEVTLPVQDILPENTTYVSSDGDCSVEGTTLKWNLTIAPGKTAEVSYTVQVNKTAAYGDAVEGTAGTVGGVSVKCPKVYVERTLTQEEQGKLVAALEQEKESDLRGMELVNALYREVLGEEQVFSTDALGVLNELYIDAGQFYVIRHTNPILDMLAPGLFGGRFVMQGSANLRSVRHELGRTRLPHDYDLIPGDILVAAADAEGKVMKLYMYNGKKMVDLQSSGKLVYLETNHCLEPVLAYNRFAILRPSMALGRSQ